MSLFKNKQNLNLFSSDRVNICLFFTIFLEFFITVFLMQGFTLNLIHICANFLMIYFDFMETSTCATFLKINSLIDYIFLKVNSPVFFIYNILQTCFVVNQTIRNKQYIFKRTYFQQVYILNR